MRAHVLWLLLACTSKEEAPPAPDAAAADPNTLRVGGQYTTQVSLARDDCGGITVESRPTSVSHVPGATDLTLTHAGQSYPGTVQRNGTFATPPRAVGSAAETHTLTIAGQFGTSGFTADVHADVSRNGVPACSYLVKWAGTKIGEANVIPER